MLDGDQALQRPLLERRPRRRAQSTDRAARSVELARGAGAHLHRTDRQRAAGDAPGDGGHPRVDPRPTSAMSIGARARTWRLRAVALAGRIEELSRYLSNISYEAHPAADAERSESRRRSHLRIADSQEQYTSAHAVRAQHLTALDEIGAARERAARRSTTWSAILERLPSTHDDGARAQAEATDRAGGGPRQRGVVRGGAGPHRGGGARSSTAAAW